MQFPECGSLHLGMYGAELETSSAQKTHSGNPDIFSYVIASSDLCNRIHIIAPASKLAERLVE